MINVCLICAQLNGDMEEGADPLSGQQVNIPPD
jgi:hypothetical protein